jgi:ectoine hydroxylase-related dioxygenase (phytanoyl-CoA dioxygenase family)
MIPTDLAATFERDGYVSPIRIHSSEAAERVRAAFDRLEAAEGRERSQIGLQDRHFDQPFVWELATDPAILDVVQAAVGPDVLLLATHFFCKYPSVGEAEARFVAWHQDVTYWGLEPPLAVTAWYAVDDADAENGCMRVIPGTHRQIREHGKSAVAGNLLSINQEVSVTADEERRAVDIPLRAGEMSLHHGMLIHGSNPNRSTRRRCGLTIRYVPAHVRQVEGNSYGKRWSAVLVGGMDRYRHFEAAAPPFARPAS